MKVTKTALFTSRCGACHTAQEGGASRAGPNLFGVAGTEAATRQGFNYSPALRNSGITWTSERLQAYLRAPTRVVPGTSMTVGVSDADQAAAVTAYLEALR